MQLTKIVAINVMKVVLHSILLRHRVHEHSVIRMCGHSMFTMYGHSLVRMCGHTVF